MSDIADEPGESLIITEPSWMAAALASFNELFIQNRLGHAYLVISEDPLQAILFTRLVAARLLCQKAGGSPCGTCIGCKSFFHKTHGDLLEVRAEPGKSAIGIDQIRAASRFLQQTALYGEIKILLIERAETMTPAAANSLLKTLEEPSGRSLLLLSVAEVWRLTATVRSRCQLVNLALPSHDEAISWLTTDHGFDQARAATALSLHNGRAVTATGVAGVVATDEMLSDLRESFSWITEAANNVAAVPTVWSDADPLVLVHQLMGWCETNIRAANIVELRSHGRHWLMLHRCLMLLWGRLSAGATPAKDILSAEIYRLFRSVPHPQFPLVAEQFLAGLGKPGVAG